MNQGQSRRPSRVWQAVMLLYVTLGIGILRLTMEASSLSQGASVGFVMFGTFAVLGIMLFFTYMIGKGRNWARITFLVLFVVGIPFAVRPLMESLAANLVSGLLGVAQTVIQVLALAFLFQKSSSDWFREMKRSRGSA